MDCGEYDELTLQEFQDRVLCRKCTLLVQGLDPAERDHSFGKRNGPETRTMDANDHARLTILQGYWPIATQQNKHRSQAVKVAAGLRRQLDLLALQREHIDQLTPEIEKLVHGLEEPDAKGDVPMDEGK